MNKSYKRHPNKLVDQHTQDLENKSLYAKIRTVKSTVNQTNKIFLQKLEERKRRELKSFVRYYSFRVPDLPQPKMHSRGSLHGSKPQFSTGLYSPAAYNTEVPEMSTRPCTYQFFAVVQFQTTKKFREQMAKKPSRGDPLGRAVTAMQSDVKRLTDLAISPRSNPVPTHQKKPSADSVCCFWLHIIFFLQHKAASPLMIGDSK